MVASSCIPCIIRTDEQNNDQNNSENNGQNNDKFEVMIEGLASGIYLGLLMLFMIPETIDDFGEVWNPKIKEPLTIYTMASSSICLGLFFVAIVEYFAAKASCCVRTQSAVGPTNQQADQHTVQPTVQQSIQAARESSTVKRSPARDVETENRPVDRLADGQAESTADQEANQSTTQSTVQSIIQPAAGSSNGRDSPARDDANLETEARPLIGSETRRNSQVNGQDNGQVESTSGCRVCIKQKNKMKINEVWSFEHFFTS